ncbi:MAG: succinate dehydrogenase, hydrophobic membrane anchor protein [Alphaproteobacteria bacterium]|nr:succinate dehydrogenase, hydrophobic membrane anchor protein [Alphaproteobacteria bacterium]
MTKLRTPLGRMRGLGSAKDGTHHWWAQRVTAIALVPLLVWLVFNVVMLTGAPMISVAHWMGHPINAALLAALVVALFHHAQLGLQVVIEDYVHCEAIKIASLLAMKGLCWILAAIAVLSIFRISVLVVFFKG